MVYTGFNLLNSMNYLYALGFLEANNFYGGQGIRRWFFLEDILVDTACTLLVHAIAKRFHCVCFKTPIMN